MYMSIRRYTMESDLVEELAERVNYGFIPLISQAPGFTAYFAINAGDGVVASISVFADELGVEVSNELAAEWVRRNMDPLLPNPPEITAGEVVAYKTM